MAEAAVCFLQEQVKEVVKGYSVLIAGAEDEFEKLQKDLDSLKGTDKSTVRDAVYEVEHAIDECFTKAIQVMAKGSRRSIFSRKKFNFAEAIKLIREDKVLPLLNRDQHRLPPPPTTKPTSHVAIRDRVVGLEDEERTLIGYLMEDEEGVDVIPIIGMPGLGKTTLARKIYQNDDVRTKFSIRIWVQISQTFNRRDVFLQILGGFSPSPDTSSLSDEELGHAVMECLSVGGFFLVLDDVWGVDAWDEIKQVLPASDRKAKVVITSHDLSVGMHCSAYRKPHQLRPLTFEESWELLQYEVFGNLEDCPPELRSTGKQIALSCGGVPLTVVVIADILLDRLSSGAATTEWQNVSTNISAALINDKTRRIDNAIELSFNVLPDELRDCFLYLGVFPEDYEIPAKMVYWLWIAEGFIQPKEGKTLEETAEENLNHLISSSLATVNKTNSMGRVRTCNVHKMIRAFCIRMSQRENLFREMIESNGELHPSASEVENIRRLCLHSSLSYFFSRNPTSPRTQSFLCISRGIYKLPMEFINVIPDGFPSLRILESKYIMFDQFPLKVIKLVHLRYLTFSIDNLTTLPPEISLLWNLQTLVVETKSRSITVKANIWNMILLRHVMTNAALVLDPKWEGEAGQNLQTLERLSTESCTEAVSKRAKNLKTLGISGRLDDILGTQFLENLHHLENLKLVNGLTAEPTPVHSLLPPNCFPPRLKKLTLAKTKLKWELMSTLAKIDTLEVLKLKDEAFTGGYWNASEYCFPRLHFLLISNADFVIWEASTESFRCLKSLALHFCENLNEIPEAIVGTLEKMDIIRVHETAVESAKTIFEKRKEAEMYGKGKSIVPLKLSIIPSHR